MGRIVEGTGVFAISESFSAPGRDKRRANRAGIQRRRRREATTNDGASLMSSPHGAGNLPRDEDNFGFSQIRSRNYEYNAPALVVSDTVIAVRPEPVSIYQRNPRDLSGRSVLNGEMWLGPVRTDGEPHESRQDRLVSRGAFDSRPCCRI